MASLYEQLEKMTVVVADTGDINSIRQFKPRDATTNPSLITAAAQMDEYQEIVDATLRAARQEAGKDAEDKAVLAIAIDQLSVEFGRRILEIVPGRVSTEVDARLSYDTEATIAKAHKLIGAYEKAGVGRDRVLIKIAATWEGIRAADKLEDDGIHCNLTLMFGLHQAVACAEAGVTLISPFVGRILDWHKKNTGREEYASHEDPGVLSVTEIYTYYKKFDYKTEVMGASFRNLGEICELAGCDLLTISPKFLAQLKEKSGDLPRKLDAEKAKAAKVERFEIDEDVFRRMHGEDKMANEKLDEGIAGFSKAIVALEELLGQRLAQLEGAERRGRIAVDFFRTFDLDGDGVITREEWCGTDAVFDAMDRDGDGRITPEELAASIGAGHIL